ncbi:hypothetical protein ODS41_10265 [Pyrobaculum sp. 3827-6]|uniref:hypothetical protein n=1 Tax=Pyrobaculum sp. 3827-6 TaxID=2983604 RepID=UPI0021D8AC4A|nr:hypothetical protein [Pyrobaculum sp. 3827-6]MCU7788294.1 hypothetical protein [Pyrobaculum sp. 3827-6]
MARRAYVQGLAQRRVKYRFDIDPPAPIRQWVSENLERVGHLLEGEWGGVFCPSASLPGLGLLLIEWMGGHLAADVSICAPVSHPAPPQFVYDVPVRRVDICVEPIAPVGGAVEYVKVCTPAVKMLGRVTLRRSFGVVKYRGLLFATEVRYGADQRGGVCLEIARYSCAQHDAWDAVRKLKTILSSRY